MSEQAHAYSFRAEVQQLLQILSHALYTDREIFLRELISNSSDALHRMRVEALTNSEIVDRDAELVIRIASDETAGTITIEDTGIGMSEAELVENLGTIAHSGAKAIMEQLEKEQRSGMIGQFGVGFYSVFAVADRVVVTTRSFRSEDQAMRWESSGGESYTIEPSDRSARGTTIEVFLRDDAKEFAQPWKIKQIVKRHSDFVAFPIMLGDEQINQTKPLWRRAPRELNNEAYEEFYRQLTMEWQPPLHTLHLSTDAPIDLHAILFVPATRERGIIERRIEGRIKLYSRSVLIQEDAKELLPNWFRFVDGVVDSEDLPLNVSRESVQRAPEIQRIRKTLTGRLTRELATLAENDAEKYRTFWTEFGPFLKEGIAAEGPAAMPGRSEPSAKEDLVKLLRFASSAGDDLVSLQQYRERMIEGQNAIYYVLAADAESARRSPHLDALKARGVEALLLSDLIDGFMLQSLTEYDGLKLVSAGDAELELPGQPDEPQAETALDDEVFERLATRIKQQLGERVTEVRASKLLTSSPARLLPGEGGAAREMQRVQRILGREYDIPPAIFELNPGHPLVTGLSGLSDERPDNPMFGLIVEQLYDSALLLDGLHPNPAGMVPRIQQLMEGALRSGNEE